MMRKVLGKRNYLFMRQSSSRYEAHGKLRERERCWKVRGFFNSILHARVCQGKSLNKGFHREKKRQNKTGNTSNELVVLTLFCFPGT